MATIVTRSGKGSPLTNTEVDANFTNLNTELGTKANTSSLATVATTGAYADLTGKPINVSSFANDSAYITSAALSPYLTSTTATSTYQPLDGDLTAIAALAGTTGFVKKTAANTYSLDTATYLTGITSGQVTTALGFTPYNATNPSGYISGITSGNVTTALGFTPYNATNPAGYITSSALSGYLPLAGGTLTGGLTLGSNWLYMSYNGGDSLRMNSFGVGFDFFNQSQGTWADVRARGAYVEYLYDKDNTAYYLDLTSSTSLNAAGSLVASGNITLNNGANRRVRIGSATNYSYDLQTTGDDFQIIEAGTTPRLTIKYPNGFVGMGTTTPQALLALGSGSASGSNPTYGGSLLIASQMSSLAQTGGIEFRSVNFASGYGHRVSSPDLGAGDTPLVFERRTNTVGWTESMRINSSGNLIAAVDVRAPIFYDSNNTGYYIDPEGGTRLGGQLEVLGSRPFTYSASGGSLTIKGDAGGWATGTYFLGSAGTNRGGFGALGGGDGLSYLWAGNAYNDAALYIYSAGHTVANTSLRAPIFYDSNDTAYYINPNEVSKTWRMGANYLQSNDDIATDTPFGIYFSNNLNSDYAIYRESGAWTSPYPDLRIAFYTGIKMGAEATYGGMRFYNSSGMAAQVMSINNSADGVGANNVFINNVLVAAGDIRAPIFYDSNNTGYYTDPNGTSNLAGLTVAGTITGSISGNAATVSSITNLTNLGRNSLIAGVVDGLTTTNFRTTMFGNAASTYNISASRWNSTPTAFSGLASYGTAIAWSGSDTHAFLALNYNSAGAKIGGGSSDNINWSADLLHSSNYTSYAMPSGSSATNSVDVRAPIFYDSNDTAYYVDPSVNSVIKTLYLRNGSIQSKFAETSNFGYSSSYKTVVLGNEYLTTISMGVDVSGNASGSFNGQGEGREVLFRNGVAFVTPNSANNGYHSAFGMVDGYAYSAGSLRAPIFYDTDNTGYYLNPAEISVLYQTNIGGGINLSGSIALNASGATLANSTGARLGENYGPVWNLSDSATWHHQVINGSMLCGFLASGTNWGSGKVVANSDMRAPIFYDYNNTAYYIDAASNSVLNTLTLGGRATTNTMYYQGFTLDANTMDTNATGFTYAVNAPYVGPIMKLGETNYSLWFNAPYSGSGYGLAFRTRNGDTATTNPWRYPAVYDVTNGGGALYATIYYDQSNSAYYLDPASNFNFLVGGYVTYTGTTSGLYVTNAESTGAVVRLGAAYNRAGVYSNTSMHVQSESTIEFWTGNGQRGYFDNSSNLFANASMRAPIFYDSNDTSYYLDPNGLSVFYKFQNINQRVTYDRAWDNYPSITVYNTTDQGPQGDFRIHGIGGANGGDFNVRLLVDGTVQSLSDVQAPIFYDSNNTGFYLDPNGTCNINRIDGNGKYAIGTGDSYLRINETSAFSNGTWFGGTLVRADGFYAGSNGDSSVSRVRIVGGTYNGSTVITLNGADGSITAAGNITAFSDIRIKANVETISSALAKLDQIRGVTYTRTDLDDKEQRYAGVIAQEIEAVLPEAVRDMGDIKTVDYNATIALLIQAVKELRDEVEMLRK